MVVNNLIIIRNRGRSRTASHQEDGESRVGNLGHLLSLNSAKSAENYNSRYEGI